MDVIPPDYPEGLYPLKQLGNDLSWEVGRLKSICKKLKITVSSVDGATYIPTDTKSILENWVIKKRGGEKVTYETSSTTTPIQKDKVKKIKSPTPTTPKQDGLVVRDGFTGLDTPESFMSALVKVMEQSQVSTPPQSPLHQQRELKDAVDMGFLLQSSQVANIFGIKKSSVSSWKTGHRRLGFVFTKVKEGNKTLWKIEQY
mgnify:CR=1 FL=1|jgi:hypothetical protein|tara:strand:- start:568 stop:1170 length:603 start_codon:yes stop_codon:yes gene_type:complete